MLNGKSGDKVADIILASQPQDDDFPALQRSVMAYTEGMERVLGISKGSLKLFDLDLLKQWVVPVDELSQ